MNKLLIVLLILVLVMYIRYNLKYNDEIQILQMLPAKLTPDILAEKNPIIIDGCQDTPSVLVRKAFAYMYLYTTNWTYTEGTLIKNNARFVVITTDNETEIEIVNPKYTHKTNYKSVVVKLHKGEIFILPMYWRFKADTNLECIAIHDIYSSVYQAIRM